MIALLALALSAPAEASEAFPLQNTSGGFLAAEFVGSALLGFVLPDLLSTAPPDPLTCADAWCEPPGLDVSINNALALDDPLFAGQISHAFTFGLTPLAGWAGLAVGAARAKRGGAFAADFVITLDALMLSIGANSIAKAGARRQRPAFHYDREDRTEAADHPDEEFVSFYSGDTTIAWTLASSTTMLCYLRGYPHARLVAYSTGSLALIGSVLRMVGDMHWFTDVAVGMATGVTLGAGLPLLLHGRKPAEFVTIRPRSGRDGTGLELTARW